MILSSFVERLLLNVAEIETINKVKIEVGYIDEICFKKVIKCWKDNIEYGDYFEQLLDFIDIKSFSATIIEYMIRENIGIEKISHMPLREELLSKLACVNEDANMILAKKMYTDSKYGEKELMEYFAKNYDDNVYEYLCVLNGSVPEKELLIDYIADKKSENESIRTLIYKRTKARTLRYETNNNILLNYLKENEYIYDLEIANNIFASEQILVELKELKGIKYCKEIKRRAEETLRKKYVIEV